MSTDDVQRSLGRIEGKLDEALKSLGKTVDDHSDDINYLKSQHSRQTGMIIGASAVLSTFWHFIPKIFAGIAN